MAEHWLRHGFGLLLMDFSGRGASDGEYVTYGMNERFDLEAMMAWLRARPEVDPKKVVYFGTSNGAAATLLAAADDPLPIAVALDAPYADLGAVGRETLARRGYPGFLIYPLELAVWLKAGLRVSSVRPVEAAVRVRCPVFITHGTADTSVPRHHSREILAARRAAGLPTEVWWLPGGEHGFDNYPPMDAYWDRVLTFYESVIGPLRTVEPSRS
jgi:dipeptidyl aminopeptidase/acylaminoacyl peptidase